MCSAAEKKKAAAAREWSEGGEAMEREREQSEEQNGQESKRRETPTRGRRVKRTGARPGKLH